MAKQLESSKEAQQVVADILESVLAQSMRLAQSRKYQWTLAEEILDKTKEIATRSRAGEPIEGLRTELGQLVGDFQQMVGEEKVSGQDLEQEQAIHEMLAQIGLGNISPDSSFHSIGEESPVKRGLSPSPSETPRKKICNDSDRLEKANSQMDTYFGDELVSAGPPSKFEDTLTDTERVIFTTIYQSLVAEVSSKGGITLLMIQSCLEGRPPAWEHVICQRLSKSIIGRKRFEQMYKEKQASSQKSHRYQIATKPISLHSRNVKITKRKNLVKINKKGVRLPQKEPTPRVSTSKSQKGTCYNLELIGW